MIPHIHVCPAEELLTGAQTPMLVLRIPARTNIGIEPGRVGTG
jgi:hypothetical protein